jgi:hypothetical protein
VVVLRRLGLMVGSLTIAWLAISLVAGVVFGPASVGNPIVGLAVIVLGGLIYREIRRREVSPV